MSLLTTLQAATMSYRDSRFKDLCEKATERLTKAASCGLFHCDIDLPDHVDLGIRLKEWLAEEERGITDVTFVNTFKTARVRWDVKSCTP